jgi:two-component system, chemotaxis family, chemotaxis protein CheY
MFDPKTRIMVLDDMMTMRKIVIKSLKDMGFTDIQEGADGNFGWEILSKSSPPIQLIVSDWNMPNCSGLDLLKKVRADSRFMKLPFVMLTAETEAHQVKEALMAGVTNYVIKPFTPEILKVKLEQTHKKVSAA